MIEIKSSNERPFSGSEWRIRFSGCTETMPEPGCKPFTPDLVLILHHELGHRSSQEVPWTKIHVHGRVGHGSHRVGGREFDTAARVPGYRIADMPRWLVDLVAEQTGLRLRQEQESTP